MEVVGFSVTWRRSQHIRGIQKAPVQTTDFCSQPLSFLRVDLEPQWMGSNITKCLLHTLKAKEELNRIHVWMQNCKTVS